MNDERFGAQKLDQVSPSELAESPSSNMLFKQCDALNPNPFSHEAKANRQTRRPL